MPVARDIEGLQFARAFKYEDLKLATKGFAEWNVLGEGLFGKVYLGMLSGKEEVAIKKLKSAWSPWFREEVEISSKVDHPNLVSLVGYCEHNDEKLLVYEYVPNKTLQFHLHDAPTLDWPKRWKIALGIAKGLAYLHEDCDKKIIHGDIKAENILLDNNFEPKVADFGLADFVPHPNKSHASTNRVTRTSGPEERSDVNSYGVMLLELITGKRLTEGSEVNSDGVKLLELITGKTGRKPIIHSHPMSSVNWAKPFLTRATNEEIFDGLIDPSLQTNYDPNNMKRLIDCAAAAVQESARKCPPMRKIEQYLEGKIINLLEDLNSGMRPDDSMVNANSTEQLRRMASGGVSSEDLDESDETSDYGKETLSGMAEPLQILPLVQEMDPTEQKVDNFWDEMREGEEEEGMRDWLEELKNLELQADNEEFMNGPYLEGPIGN